MDIKITPQNNLVCKTLFVTYFLALSLLLCCCHKQKRHETFQEFHLLKFHPFTGSPSDISRILKTGNSIFIGLKDKSGELLSIYQSANGGRSWEEDKSFQQYIRKMNVNVMFAYPELSNDKKNIIVRLEVTNPADPTGRSIKIFIIRNIRQGSPWRNLSKIFDASVHNLKACTMVSDSTGYVATTDGGYYFDFRTNTARKIFTKPDDIISKNISSISIALNNGRLFVVYYFYIDDKSDTRFFWTDIANGRSIQINFPLKSTTGTLYNLPKVDFIQYAQSRKKWIIPVDQIIIYYSFREVIHTKLTLDSIGNVSQAPVFKKPLWDRASTKWRTNWFSGTPFVYSAELKTPDLADFVYSIDSGAHWIPLRTPKPFLTSVLMPGALYLRDTARQLLGFCEPDSQAYKLAAHKPEQNGNELILSFSYPKVDTTNLEIRCAIYDKNLDNSISAQFVPLKKTAIKTRVKSDEITTRVDLSALPFKLKDNDSLEVKYDISNRQNTLTPRNLHFVYKAASLKDHSTYLIAAATVLGFYAILLIISYTRPFWLFRFYSSKLYPLLDEIPGLAGKIIKQVNKVFFFNFFIANDRVVGCWVKMYGPVILETFRNNQAVSERKDYVDIPITEKTSTGAFVNEVKEPDIKYFDQLVNDPQKKKSVIQIIGVGGTGKSSLAFKFLSELADPELVVKSGIDVGHVTLPILIQTETVDIFDLIRKELTRITEPLDDDFFKVLLSRKKISIVIDALSEKEQSTRDHIVEAINYDNRTGSIIITSRRVIETAQAAQTAFIYPEPISSSQLIPFAIDLLNRKGVTFFKKAAHQALLSVKLSRIVAYDEREVAITPILINLALDPIVKYQLNHAVTNEQVADDVINEVLSLIPGNIPSLYSSYVRGVNKPFRNIEIPDDALLDMVGFLCQACLSFQFTPKEIDRDDLQSEFRKANFGVLLDHLLDLLESSGLILLRKDEDNFIRLAFLLDPLCENFAARYKAGQCRDEIIKWNDLYGSVLNQQNFPLGFAQLLLLIHRISWERKGWASPDSVAVYAQVESKIFGSI
jgi:hypothetical protein